jgi:hypothetical protein
MSDDPIGDALRADAEEARAEMRAAGIICPSCGGNLGDLYGKGHRYEDIGPAGIPVAVASLKGTFRCADGQPVDVTSLDFEQFKAVAEIAFLDGFWAAESDYLDKHVFGAGDGKGFTGLLEML